MTSGFSSEFFHQCGRVGIALCAGRNSVSDFYLSPVPKPPIDSVGFAATFRRNSPLQMSKPEITAYLKTHCGWSKGVRAVLAKYDIPYTEKDIILNPDYRFEMEQLSGQPLSPCVVVNGVMLPDLSGEELESYMLANGLVGESAKETDVPLNSACSDEEHAAMVKLKL